MEINNLQNTPEYIELNDSGEHDKSSPMVKHHPVVTSGSLPANLTGHLDKTKDVFSKTRNMTTINNKESSWQTTAHQNNLNTMLADMKSRPLPEINESSSDTTKLSVSKPPYYNVLNEPIERAVNKTTSSPLGTKRPSYTDLPQLQTSDGNSYSELTSVTDHYDIFPSVSNQRSNVTLMSTKRTPRNKKLTYLSICVNLFALLAVLGATLAAILLVGSRIDDNVGSRLEALSGLQIETKTELIKYLQTFYSSNEKASDLRVIYGDSCYCLYRDKKSWFAARDFCLDKGNGVHLAEIYTKEVNEFMMPILQAALTNAGIWLGASDLRKDGVWIWNFTGKPIEQFEPSPWGPGQPSSVSHLGKAEHCMDVYNWDVTKFRWNDNNCEEANPFLCSSSLMNSRCFC